MTGLLIISSVAIAATLLYASFVDIKQRRVPFKTWYPSLVVALCIIIYFYFTTYGDPAGFNPLLFAIFPFALAALLLIFDWIFTVYIRKTPASGIDASVIAESYISWLLLSVPGSVIVLTIITGYSNIFSVIALLSLIFCIFLEIISVLHLWGGADSSAMMVISSTVPVFPLIPLWGYPEVAFFFPMSVLLNAVILNLAVPAGLFVYNILKGNKAPLKYMFVGYPVPGEDIMNHFGFVIEEFEESETGINRKFIKFGSSIGRMVSGKRRMYTQDFRKNPDDYETELDLYKKAGSVWISFGVPFMIPILAGFLFSLFIGDIFSMLLQIAGL